MSALIDLLAAAAGAVADRVRAFRSGYRGERRTDVEPTPDWRADREVEDPGVSRPR